MIKPTVKWQVKSDRLPAIRNAIANLNNAQAHVGWETQETYPGTDVTVSQVAIFNEYGTKGPDGEWKVPPRPFMRQAYAKNLKMIIASQIEAHDKVMRGEWTVEKGLYAIGYRFQEAVRSEILRGDFEVNAPTTLARKRAQGQGGRPLVATRRMLNALRVRLELNAQAIGDTTKQNDDAAAKQAKAGQAQADKRQARKDSGAAGKQGAKTRARNKRAAAKQTREAVRAAKEGGQHGAKEAGRFLAKKMKAFKQKQAKAKKETPPKE